jgi:flagellar basal-body rod protein FlgB
MATALDRLFQLHQTALGARSTRSQVLASNIANADTPGFQARDLEFKNALRSALGPSQGAAVHPAPAGLVRTSARHLAAAESGHAPAPGTALVYRTVAQPSIDNNTVDVNVERAQFADNAMRYEASLTFINGKIKSLLAALQS